MSSLKAIEKRLFEDMFGMASGYIIDKETFSNSQFAEFSVIPSISTSTRAKYAFNGDSKAKR